MKKILLFSFLFMALVVTPILVFAQNPAGNQWVIDRINNIINRFVWPSFWGAVLVLFLWIGFMYLNAHGDQGRVSTAHKATLWAIVGIIVALLGFSAINIINGFIGQNLQCNGTIFPNCATGNGACTAGATCQALENTCLCQNDGGGDGG